MNFNRQNQKTFNQHHHVIRRCMAGSLLGFILLLNGCKFEHKSNTSSDLTTAAKIVTETREVEDFDAIDSQVSFDIDVEVGQVKSIQVQGTELSVKEIEMSVNNRVLVIRKKSNRNESIIRSDHKIRIATPKLLRLVNAREGDVSIRGLNNETFDVVSNGSGDVRLEGATKSLTIDSVGSGDANLSQFSTQKAVLKHNGSGDITARVMSQLNLDQTGSGDIEIEGLLDAIVQVQSNGSGNLNINGQIKQVQLKQQGSGDVKIGDLVQAKAQIELSGSGDFDIAGSAADISIIRNGAGDFNAEKLLSNKLSYTLNGAGDADLGGVLEDASIKTMGSGTVKLNSQNAKLVQVNLQGSGDVEIVGTAELAKANLQGIGNLMAGDLIVPKATVNISSSAEAFIHVKNRSGDRELHFNRSGTVD